jgi:hypothetical protein
MDFRRRLLAAAAVAAFASPAGAQWTESERAEFHRDCLQSCQTSPRVAESNKPQCNAYCVCMGEETSKAEPNYPLLDDDFRHGRDTPRVQAARRLTAVCSDRVLSR